MTLASCSYTLPYDPHCHAIPYQPYPPSFHHMSLSMGKAMLAGTRCKEVKS